MESTDQTFLRRMHDYQRVSGVLWIVWGILQILSICVLFVFGIPVALIGAWNIYAGVTRLNTAPRILAGDPSVPAQFENLTGLLVVAVLNLVFGAILGVVVCILDFYIRDQILSHRHLFGAQHTKAGSSMASM